MAAENSCVCFQRRGGGRKEEGFVDLHPVGCTIKVCQLRIQLSIQALDRTVARAYVDGEQLVEAPDRGEQADGRIDHDRAADIEPAFRSVDRFHDGRISASEAVAEHVDARNAGFAGQMRDHLLHGCV